MGVEISHRKGQIGELSGPLKSTGSLATVYAAKGISFSPQMLPTGPDYIVPRKKSTTFDAAFLQSSLLKLCAV